MDLRTAQSILQQEINRRTAVEYLIQAVDSAAQSEEKVQAAEAALETLKGATRNAEAANVKAVADAAHAKALADKRVKELDELVAKAKQGADEKLKLIEGELQRKAAEKKAVLEADAAEDARKAKTMAAALSEAVSVENQKLDEVLAKIQVAEKRLAEVHALINRLKEA